MDNDSESIIILMAEDDPDDQKITRKAFECAKLNNRLLFVNDGQELLDYLRRKGGFNEQEHPFPDIILLDLNMPRKDGRTALKEIREDEKLNYLPVVAMTTSKAEQDILDSYKLGVNSFITKPVTFDELVKVVQELNTYWVEIVKLPHL